MSNILRVINLLKESIELLEQEKVKNGKNCVRIFWFWIFLVMGFILLLSFFPLLSACLDRLNGYWLEIVWCFSWGAIGIAFGLYNSRTDKEPHQKYHKHYWTYFLFVWGIAVLAAFVAMGSFEKDIVRSYAAAALVGIVIGFTGDKLAGKIFGLSKQA